MRRSGVPESDLLEACGIQIDLGSHRLIIQGTNIHIGPTEYRLLVQLLDHIWGRSSYIERNTNRRCTHVKAAQKDSSLLVWTERSRPCAAWAIASRRSLDEARIGENADTSPLLFGVIENRRLHRAYCRCSPSGARIKLRATTAAPVCCVHFLERRPHCLKIQVTR